MSVVKRKVPVDLEFVELLDKFFQDMEPPRSSLVDDCDLAVLYDYFYSDVVVHGRLLDTRSIENC